MSDIIMVQELDLDRNKITPGTLHGTAVLSAASTVPQWVNVGVSVGIFNVSTATCNGHCPYCANFTGFQVQADIGTAPVGQDTEFSSWAESSDNTWIDYTLQSQWTSSNIQVAPPSCCTVGAFTGVSPGSFTATASATLEGGIYDCPADCSPSYFQADATGTVTPQITSISPSNGLFGAGVNVTISGQGFNGTNLTVSAGSGIITSVQSSSSTQIQVFFAISSSTSGGNRNVSVTASGQTSNTVVFTLPTPDHLQVVKDNSFFICNGSVVVRQITLAVVDQNEAVVGTTPVSESFRSLTQNTCGNGSPQPTACANTDNALSQFTDTITINSCNTPGGSCGYNLTDDWQWCAGLQQTMGTLTDTVHANQVTVNGVASPSQIPAGTDIRPQP
jgi:IPT/TIG domain-containing protein